MSREDELVEYGRSLFNRGRTHGRTGNLSFRRDDEIVVTPTGASLGSLDPAGLSVLDLDGDHRGGPEPTKEASLHAAVYRARPADTAVVHLHASHAVAVSCLADRPREDVLPPLTAYYVMRVGRCPLIPYHAPGDPGLVEPVHEVAREHHAFLIANHGPVVSGPDLATAVDAIEELEATAKLFLLLSGHRTRPLTTDQAANLRTSRSATEPPDPSDHAQ